MSEAFFKTEVLDASENVPIVVDFWAPWCGPCRVLGPLLEQLETESKGAWRLVKINTDDQESIAKRLQIQSLPTVMLIHKGEVLGEFTGALPRPQVEAWLQEHLPNPTREALTQAHAARCDGRMAEALQRVDAALAESPAHPEARVAKAELILLEQPTAAMEGVADIVDTDPLYPRIEAMKTLADVLERADAIGAQAASAESKGWVLYHQGLESLGNADVETALQAWIEALGRKPDLDDGALKNSCKALFVWLGDDHPLSQEYRRAFASALF